MFADVTVCFWWLYSPTCTLMFLWYELLKIIQILIIKHLQMQKIVDSIDV